LSIVDIEPNEKYIAALKNFLEDQGIKMTRIQSTVSGQAG